MTAKKWLDIGIRFIPYVGGIMQAAEAIKDAKGAEKAEAVKRAVTVGLEATEFALDKDLLLNDKVQEAIDRYRDAYVNLQNAIAATKASRVSAPDATGHP